MYTIYADNICVYDDTSPDTAYKALSPSLTLTAGAAGSLSLTLPKGNAGYDSVQRLTSTISVLRDGEVIWLGRVLSEKRDFWGSRELFCEGALAFLNDTVPMLVNPSLASVLTAHNGKVAEDRRVLAGEGAGRGDVADADGSTSLEIINSKLVGGQGGVLRMRYPGGVPTLDWLMAYPPITGDEQSLTFGENLLEFTRNWDLSDYSTYAYVQGAEVEQPEPEEGQPEPPKDWYKSGWVTVGDAASLYGRIEKYLNYSDLTSDAACVAAAQTYLATQQFADMTLEITAVDLHILNPAVQSFDLLETVHVSSPPHGLEGNFVVTGMDIPLDAPERTRYTLGNRNIAYVRRVNTITKVTQKNQQEALDYADTAAEGAVADAEKYTNRVKTTLEAADAQITARVEDTEGNLASLTLDVNGIETRVTNAEGDITTVTQTANEIKGKVSETTTDPITGETTTTWTVANLKADGFHIADASGATLITGRMIDVDTIHVNKLYGGTITFVNDSGGTSGSFYLTPVVTPYAPGYQLSLSFEQIDLGTMPVLIPSADNVFLRDGSGGYVSLQSLLDAKADKTTT